MTDALLAATHFLCIILLVVFLSAEAVLLRPNMTPAVRDRLVRYDRLYGLSAVLVLASGLGRLYWGAKGVTFIASNPVFHLKMTVFVLMILCSLPVTLRLLRWRKQGRQVPHWVPAAAEIHQTRRWVMWQAHLMIILPLCAAFMARGLRF